jgi:2-polyprenyl-3-methyl-5-hydroxy-6-metoxy-1,4-benzoquinol methylase
MCRLPKKEYTAEVFEVIRGLKECLLDVGGLDEGFSFHDVGCGFGASVWAMQQLGVRATGNEANQEWMDAANKHCGGNLSAKPLQEVLSALPYKIDAFFCAHVLEHVPDPLAQLRLMSQHMSDQGVAYLCMPNIHNVRTIRSGVRDSAAYFFPMHLNYFTPKSLVAMVRDAGLEPVQIETRSMFDDEATPQDCEKLRGWELFMLAAKPCNTRAKRQENIDIRCEQAFQHFNNASRMAPVKTGR